MEDQKQKPKPTKQVRVRFQYTARIEVVENDEVVDERILTHPIEPFDVRGLKEAFDFVDIARQAKEIEIEQEFEREQELKLESEKTVLQNAYTFLTSIFN